MNDISVFLALGAGILSFFSPCILPLIPAYLSFITGMSVDRLQEDSSGKGVSGNWKKVLPETILFILGFSFIFISLGASATYFSNLIFTNRNLIKTIGGIIVIIFGLHLAGVFNIKFLQVEKKVHLKSRPGGRMGSFVIGAVFAFGWTPCLGPILGGIYTMAATKSTVGEGILLLSFYSLGLAIPFVVTSIFVGWILGEFSRIRKYFRLISVVSGLLLVIIGMGMLAGFFRF
ncbi:hypothetical protein AUJ66_08330 [Candidatus Desantisbacteria bacterium CG1_02_38_46]|uniref:Cytochrome C biogenesis protein n=3 Tax=unclassified Candidatus Desantisiibacteriota TaxID=3106372 RepID=A0A2H9PC51_9BACT|nr:MAG: hypothetical protein AUJ66_08330 [Candidatus Desantisbacteria bacterium CG1_02_38_46]PIU50900.1 MAG: cytochrome C biogenesis protein [Candidatus Desantisbacteria bacterium CG07_land_8_20_14_0_80_39_15]PIZ16628.1 MAG: cytochrome C biogenesis protein [Candidatus Desantisbacteria bacterium CG_4_10_14_0_8_um_filter_39_17]